MCEEVLIETLLATTKKIGLFKVCFLNVFTNCQKYVILREAFKWLLKDGENGCMDWIEIFLTNKCETISKKWSELAWK